MHSAAEATDPEPPLLWAAGLCDGATFTLLTTDASARLAWLHDRMPVVLDEAGLVSWLTDSEADALGAMRRCEPRSADSLAWQRMSRLDYSKPDCSANIKLGGQHLITSFFASVGAAADGKYSGKRSAETAEAAVVKKARGGGDATTSDT